MNIPAKDSPFDLIAELIYRRGPLRLQQIQAALPGDDSAVVKTRLAQLRGDGVIYYNGNCSHLTQNALAHYGEEETKPARPLVPHRTVNIWTPAMVGYEAMMRAAADTRRTA